VESSEKPWIDLQKMINGVPVNQEKTAVELHLGVLAHRLVLSGSTGFVHDEGGNLAA
jgi:hypothetical protein